MKILSIVKLSGDNEIYYQVGQNDITDIKYVNVKYGYYDIYRNNKLHSSLFEWTEICWQEVIK